MLFSYLSLTYYLTGLKKKERQIIFKCWTIGLNKIICLNKTAKYLFNRWSFNAVQSIQICCLKRTKMVKTWKINTINVNQFTIRVNGEYVFCFFVCSFQFLSDLEIGVLLEMKESNFVWHLLIEMWIEINCPCWRRRQVGSMQSLMHYTEQCLPCWFSQSPAIRWTYCWRYSKVYCPYWVRTAALLDLIRSIEANPI